MPHPILRGGVASPQNILESSAVKHHTIGTQGFVDERTFRYASFVGGTALVPGQLCALSAETSQISIAYASGGAAGQNKVTFTLAAQAVAEGIFNDGWLASIDGTGSNQLRRIKTHPSAGSGATLELTLYEPLETAFAAADEVSLIRNTYSNVRLHTGADVMPVGVPSFTIPVGSTTTQYFWIQTGGPAMVWGDGSAFIQGDLVVPADATADAGQVSILAGTTVAAVLNLVKRYPVGRVISAGDTSDADYRLIHLSLE